MATFRFRAQAALDLRRRELDAARRELADVERVRDDARERVRRAESALAGARAAGTARARQPGSVTDWHWYRIWILRLEHERTAECAVLTTREAQVATALRVVVLAHQRWESLDRLRVKAREAFDAAEAAAERKLIDELATSRYLVGARNAQGVSS